MDRSKLLTPYFCVLEYVRSNPSSYILSSREEYDRVTYLYSKRPGIYGVRNGFRWDQSTKRSSKNYKRLLFPLSPNNCPPPLPSSDTLAVINRAQCAACALMGFETSNPSLTDGVERISCNTSYNYI